MGTTYVAPLATVRLEMVNIEGGGGGGGGGGGVPVVGVNCFSVEGALSFPDVSNAVTINP